MTIAAKFMALPVILFGLVSSAPVHADASQIEHVLLLEANGSLVVEPDGSVVEVRLDTKVSAALQAALESTLRKLRFQPVKVHGEVVRAKTGFHVVLAGTQEGDAIRARIDSIEFPAPKGETPVRRDDQKADIAAGKLGPPVYPREEARSGIMGMLKVAIRSTPDGRTAEASVLSSLLYDNGIKPERARRAIHAFEQAALAAVRTWTYKVPPDAAARGPDGLTAVTRIAFVLDFRQGFSVSTPGQWLPVQRLPEQPIAWLPPAKSKALLETAVASDGLSAASSFKLAAPAVGMQVL